MFHSARIKLTLWYLLIIMLISMFFSMVIYSVITRELDRGLRRAQMRLRYETEEPPFIFRQMPPRLEELTPRLAEDLEQAKIRVIWSLLTANGVILTFSAIAGYFLAGKTLKPIETAMEEQKRFVADASHELRTPLTSIKTTLEVALRDKKMSVSEANSVLKSNLEDIDGMESLTNNLLSLSRIQTNGNHHNFGKVNLKELINKTYRQIMPLAKSKQIKVSINSTDGEVNGDRDSLEKMLLVFWDNAVKYTQKKGSINVSFSKDSRNTYTVFKDNGIGIEEKDLPHIFDRFYRADSSRSKDTIGFGLGLSLAKKIIQMHKGSIKAKSKTDEGSIFTIKLPLA